MADIRESLDLAYGHHPLHRFDVYVGPNCKDNVLICFIHGGAWRSEDKADFNAFAHQLATFSECTILVPNYRLTPRQPTSENSLHHPAHAEDILLFLNFLVDWAGPDDLFASRKEPRKLYLTGHSCSAHMLASIFLDSTSVTPTLTPSPRVIQTVQGIVCSEGILDIDRLIATFPEYRDTFIGNTFGRQKSYVNLSPVHYMLREGTHHIRWLIIHSKGDTWVDMPQSQGMYEHLVDLYRREQLPAEGFVQANMDVLEQEHNDIFVDALRDEFILPTLGDVGAINLGDADKDSPCAYLCGNSLGALSKRSKTLIQEEVQVWASKGVDGHFHHPLGRDWAVITKHVHPILAEIVGAKEDEVCCMGNLTTNLHILMLQFYNPTADRYKILCEAKAFPSDQYAFASQVSFHGFDPKEAVMELSPRPGEFCLREEDILDVISKEGSKIALVIFGGIQFYTGQLFPIRNITKAAKEQGCICGWDLAHAIGNVPLSLHDWDVDFAVWCSYKYLNSGPGGIAGLFMHDKWAEKEIPKFAGWWGQECVTRFAMEPTFKPLLGAQGFQQSNPSALAIASLLGSLQVFKSAGMMTPIRKRSVELTGTLESLLKKSRFYVPVEQSSSVRGVGFTIITPSDPESRGAQLSLVFLPPGEGVMQKVCDGLKLWGVIGDSRNPDVIRLSPAPLYNDMKDCEKAAEYLEKTLESLDM